METATPFYFDWSFWQGAAAVIALIVSLTPSVRRLLIGARLEVESHDLISLAHTIGNPNVGLFLILRNTGGVPIRIKAIRLELRPRDGEAFQLNAQTYYPLLTEDKQVIFAPFKLSPGEDWAHTVYFYTRFSRNEDREFRQITSNLRADLMAKKVASSDSTAEADPENVTPVTQFFERKFKWNSGEYDINVCVDTDNKQADTTKQFRMTIYESDANQLRGYAEEYKIGLGAAYFDLNRQPPISISIDSK